MKIQILPRSRLHWIKIILKQQSINFVSVENCQRFHIKFFIIFLTHCIMNDNQIFILLLHKNGPAMLLEGSCFSRLTLSIIPIDDWLSLSSALLYRFQCQLLRWNINLTPNPKLNDEVFGIDCARSNWKKTGFYVALCNGEWTLPFYFLSIYSFYFY